MNFNPFSSAETILGPINSLGAAICRRAKVFNSMQTDASATTIYLSKESKVTALGNTLSSGRVVDPNP
jgi:hypothetical protein